MAEVDTSLFKPELVFFDFEAASQEDFFEKLGARLKELGYVKDGWVEAIETRERNYPTGLRLESLEVAIPHVEPDTIERPYIAVIKPTPPVEFHHMAEMGEPVQAQLIVNLGLLAHATDQVKVLQALMEVFSDDAKVARIMAVDDPQEMVDTMVELCS